jgi:hypothetical protein
MTSPPDVILLAPNVISFFSFSSYCSFSSYQILFNIRALKFNCIQMCTSIQTLNGGGQVITPLLLEPVWLVSQWKNILYNAPRLSRKLRDITLWHEVRHPCTSKQHDECHTKKRVADHDGATMISQTFTPPLPDPLTTSLLRIPLTTVFDLQGRGVRTKWINLTKVIYFLPFLVSCRQTSQGLQFKLNVAIPGLSCYIIVFIQIDFVNCRVPSWRRHRRMWNTWHTCTSTYAHTKWCWEHCNWEYHCR